MVARTYATNPAHFVDQFAPQLKDPELTLAYTGALSKHDATRLTRIPSNVLHVTTDSNGTVRYAILLHTELTDQQAQTRLFSKQTQFSKALGIQQKDWAMAVRGGVARGRLKFPLLTRKIDSYEDDVMTISSYSTPVLAHVKDVPMNVQIAWHGNQVTIGYPVIPIEM
jgi:hypothetical protein